MKIYNPHKDETINPKIAQQKGRVGKSISAQASHRTVRESLPSHGS